MFIFHLSLFVVPCVWEGFSCVGGVVVVRALTDTLFPLGGFAKLSQTKKLFPFAVSRNCHGPKVLVGRKHHRPKLFSFAVLRNCRGPKVLVGRKHPRPKTFPFCGFVKLSRAKKFSQVEAFVSPRGFRETILFNTCPSFWEPLKREGANKHEKGESRGQNIKIKIKK